MTTSMEQQLTDLALARLADDADPRFRRLMTSLIRHLHAVVREVELTEAEWFEAIKFLTATGQKSDDRRQEFILLSDVLGASMLVDAINHRRPAGATENTVLGPFYVHGAREIALGADMAAGWKGEPTVVSGRVQSIDGTSLAGALLDLWQSNADGLYDVQLPKGDERQLRARLRAGADGRFWFRTIKPTSYPVPTDGPVGLILSRMGRHPYRPAHLHFIVSAPGHETAVTHLFVKGDPYLESDAVFAVKDSLVAEWKTVDSPAEAKKLGMPNPFLQLEFDVRLAPESGAKARQKISAADAVA
jgi:protocatechuate 3,4-dioxygenase beta subunit